MADHKRFLILVLSDTQCGYKFGVANPNTILPPMDEKGDAVPLELSATQQLLWGLMLGDMDEAERMAAGDPICILHIGDVTQGTLLPDSVLTSNRISDQVLIAADVLEPWMLLPNVKWVFLTKGSGIHAMHHGATEMLVANLLTERTKLPVEAWYHMNLFIKTEPNPIGLDIAHKGAGTSLRSWLRGNELRFYVRNIMQEYLKSQATPPDIVLRGHFHDRMFELVHEHTWQKTYRTWGIVAPAYSLFIDDYTKSKTRSKSHMTVGTVVIEVIDGHVVWVYDDLVHTVDIRRTITMEV